MGLSMIQAPPPQPRPAPATGKAEAGWRQALTGTWWPAQKASAREAPGNGSLQWLTFTLLPLSLAYRLLFAVHGWTARFTARHRPRDGIPTVVIGNWVLGGAGKTPTTLAVLEHLKARGWTPGVVSRGYGRRGSGLRLVDPQRDRAEDVGDEPLLIARSAQVPVMVGADRVAGSTRLKAACPEVDIVVADDGLQHHHLQRDVEIVVVDERGAGNGHCLPAGPLRQPIPARLRPNTLLLYSSGLKTLPLNGHLARRTLAGIQTLGAWQRGEPPAPSGGWAELKGVEVVAAAGIAVPGRFFDALEERGLRVIPCPLPDHYRYDTLPWPEGSTPVVVTEKDAVKLAGVLGELQTSADDPARRDTVWVAKLDLAPEASFWSALDERLEPLRRKPHGQPPDRTAGVPPVQGASDPQT